MKVTFEELKGAFYRVLRSRNIAEDTADECAEMFARTTESGVYSHGVNARRQLRLAGGGKRLYRHLLDQLHRRHAAVGGERVPYRYQSADRRHPVYADHDGRYVDVDVLLRNVRS